MNTTYPIGGGVYLNNPAPPNYSNTGIYNPNQPQPQYPPSNMNNINNAYNMNNTTNMSYGQTTPDDFGEKSANKFSDFSQHQNPYPSLNSNINANINANVNMNVNPNGNSNANSDFVEMKIVSDQNSIN